VARQLGQPARKPGAAEVLDAGDESLGEDLEAALDEHLLGERVTDLDAGPLGLLAFLERRAGQHADAADAVAAGLGADEDHPVARSGRLRELEVAVLEDADAERVDERVALVGRVEDDLAADVGQAQAVAVAADARDDAVDDALGVGVLRVSEPQRVHHCDRPRAHRQDVADDAAHTGRGTLVRLDVRRVVVALDLERDRQALADVDDAGVLTHADEQDVDFCSPNWRRCTLELL
jgi:hypothetical protein